MPRRSGSKRCLSRFGACQLRACPDLRAVPFEHRRHAGELGRLDAEPGERVIALIDEVGLIRPSIRNNGRRPWRFARDRGDLVRRAGARRHGRHHLELVDGRKQLRRQLRRGQQTHPEPASAEPLEHAADVRDRTSNGAAGALPDGEHRPRGRARRRCRRGSATRASEARALGADPDEAGCELRDTGHRKHRHAGPACALERGAVVADDDGPRQAEASGAREEQQRERLSPPVRAVHHGRGGTVLVCGSLDPVEPSGAVGLAYDDARVESRLGGGSSCARERLSRDQDAGLSARGGRAHAAVATARFGYRSIARGSGRGGSTVVRLIRPATMPRRQAISAFEDP